MSDWSDQAEAILIALPPSDAERILRAVDDLERTRRGFVIDPRDQSGGLHLYVGRYVVVFIRDGQAVSVVDILRRR